MVHWPLFTMRGTSIGPTDGNHSPHDRVLPKDCFHLRHRTSDTRSLESVHEASTYPLHPPPRELQPCSTRHHPPLTMATNTGRPVAPTPLVAAGDAHIKHLYVDEDMRQMYGPQLQCFSPNSSTSLTLMSQVSRGLDCSRQSGFQEAGAGLPNALS